MHEPEPTPASPRTTGWYAGRIALASLWLVWTVASAWAGQRPALPRTLFDLGQQLPSAQVAVRRGAEAGVPTADLVIEWKWADADWASLFAQNGLTRTYRLRLHLDPATRQCDRRRYPRPT